MKNVNPNVINLFTGPNDAAAALQLQQLCHEMLAAGPVDLTVWFFSDAVKHVLPPQVNNAAKDDIYTAWTRLVASGVKLRACQAACQRRLPQAYLQQTVFEISSLTQWADQIIATEDSVSCRVRRPLVDPKLLREQIDQILVLLALDISVTVVFYPEGINHLLEEVSWRRWRMLPELEQKIRFIAISKGLGAQDVNILGTRPAVEILPELVLQGKIIDV